MSFICFSFFTKSWYFLLLLTLNLCSFIEVPVPSQERESLYIHVRGIHVVFVSMVTQLDFGIVLTMWYILCFILLTIQ